MSLDVYITECHTLEIIRYISRFNTVHIHYLGAIINEFVTAVGDIDAGASMSGFELTIFEFDDVCPTNKASGLGSLVVGLHIYNWFSFTKCH